MATLVSGILTLSPTHPGAGGASASVDLPIARDPTTGFPILPATALKGVARAAMEGDDTDEGRRFVTRAFGPKLGDAEAAKQAGGTEPGAAQPPGRTSQLEVGTLVFGEGQLLLYPMRALHRPVVYATCPLLLRRWSRTLRAFGGVAEGLAVTAPKDAALANVPSGALIVEDVALRKSLVQPLQGKALADQLLRLLPAQEDDFRTQVSEGLALLSDELFATILRRAVPVQTRIRLNEHKTTTDGGGNLWYEEFLPMECVFGAVIADRDDRRGTDTAALKAREARLGSTQLGGNETVGMGRVAWTLVGAP